MRRVLAIICLSLLLVSGVGAAYWHTRVFVPMKRIMDLEWRQRTTPAEQRDLCHEIVGSPFARWAGPGEHDAVLLLAEVGDETSVPLLMRILPEENGPHVCTWAHCRDTLRTLTGEGTKDWTFEDWHRWWADEGRARYGAD